MSSKYIFICINKTIYDGWRGGWVTSYRATCSGFNSRTEKPLIHKLLFRVWLFVSSPTIQEKILVLSKVYLKKMHPTNNLIHITSCIAYKFFIINL
uniref:SFRICE_001385 n=1 Tax=Spodoptera frugiperda TaxID=7108 RepID=A0A2H1VSY2_SPOFR